MFGFVSQRKKVLHVQEMDTPARITRAASKQTYFTIRFLVDRDRMLDAFRAYAYFRWLDDTVDSKSGTREDKLLLVARQCELMEADYRNESPVITCDEEQLLMDLVAQDTEKESGLQLYVRNMMALMLFDAQRRGREITQTELFGYSQMLSTAVTEYMFFFFGHRDPPPDSLDRYQAVWGAHIVHMLRDMASDITLGYINIPSEELGRGISLDDLQSLAMRKWLAERLRLAQEYLENGRNYIARVKNMRCRLAGFAYLARFEWMLRAIGRDHYCLRISYPERKSLWAASWMTWYVLASLFNLPVKRARLENPVTFQVNMRENEI